ncbi:hypothetical protein [uncultured Piscinibacter sp.]|uniref:hypothetical protein n=1 Tax=uncultured Piscinibacter sp. TaxID=1131835 RepID=UPI00345B59AB
MLSDTEHAALHWQQAGHHHHEDGSYHLDDSNESDQHVIADHVSASAALVTLVGHDFPSALSSSPRGLNEGRAPHPFLDGLLRPPRRHS